MTASRILDGIEESVDRPTVVYATKFIKSLLLIPQKVKSIVTFSPVDFKNTDWNINGRDSKRFGPLDEKVNVLYSTSSDLATVTTYRYRNVDSVEPVFYDEVGKYSVTPMYTDTNVSLEFTFSTKSKSTINRCATRLRRLISEGSTDHLLETTYIFVIDEKTLNFMNLILDIKNKVFLEEKAFVDYLQEVSDLNKLTILSDISGEYRELNIGMEETQTGITIKLDPSILGKEVQFDKGTGFWSLTTSWTFTFNRPDTLWIDYEPIVCNQLLPESLRVVIDPYKDFGSHELFPGFNIPNFIDTETGNTQVADPYAKIITITTTIVDTAEEPEGSRGQCLFNLSEMGNIKLTEQVIEYLKASEYSYLNQIYKGLFNLQFHGDGLVLDSNDFTVDSELNICTQIELDITVTYTVTLRLIKDINILPDKVYKRVKDYDVVSDNNLIETIVEVIADSGELYKVADSSFNMMFTKMIFNTILTN